MRKIDNLILRASNLARAKLPFFCTDPAFCLALGFDAGSFAVTNPDGSTGYNELKALKACAAKDWETGADLIGSLPEIREPVRRSRREPVPVQRPEYLTVMELESARSALTETELIELLAFYPVLIGTEKRVLSVEEAKQLNHGSSESRRYYNGTARDLFGWG